MNILKTLRKPYMGVFLASVILFVSCNQYDNDAVPLSIDALALKNMHNDIKIDLSNVKFDPFQISGKSSEESEAENMYIENLEYFNLHGAEQLFIKNNLDTEIIAELEYFNNNQDSENVYQELIENFNIDRQEEASVLFTIIEVKKIIEQELESSYSSKYSKSQMRSVSWGCALAIAGVVGVSVFAILSGPITGGASLVAFLGSKALATASLIEACGDGWGEIE